MCELQVDDSQHSLQSFMYRLTDEVPFVDFRCPHQKFSAEMSAALLTASLTSGTEYVAVFL